MFRRNLMSAAVAALGALQLLEEKKPHERRGARRSSYTIYRQYRHSNIHREPGYVKRSRTNKSYAAQAKGFREGFQTPTQLARLNANLAGHRQKAGDDAQ
jgi:hypothetical protein